MIHKLGMMNITWEKQNTSFILVDKFEKSKFGLRVDVFETFFLISENLDTGHYESEFSFICSKFSLQPLPLDFS